MFVISLIVYTLTLEPSVPLWDCGEFISGSNSLQVVHPPGAPMFLMLGRFFALFSGIAGNTAIAVNMLSAFASAGTVMFTFWITTHLARKVLGHKVTTGDINVRDAILVYGAGAVSALALTFMDTFWFSAVEAEVYAASSCFTALSFWGIIKWESVKNEPRSDRWLVFIAFTIGLGIGIHLLNLLVLPAVILYYFLNKYEVTTNNLIKAGAIGAGSLVFLNFMVIPGLPTIGAAVDKIFVNSMGLPYLSGLLFTVVLFTALIIWGIWYTVKKKMPLLNLSLVCFAFVMMGYYSYTMVPIRSLAEPAIDMNDPEDGMAIKSYIKREQYGDRPLFKGPYYFANSETSPTAINEGAMQYRRGDEKYEPVGPKLSYDWPENYTTILPRMGDMSEKSQGYKIWYNEVKRSDGTTKIPSFGQNMGFMFKYQFGWMYWRYFFWNFAGRQSDIQNIDGNPFDGNWMSGINAIDDARLGTQEDIPDSLTWNDARNKYYMLPFLLGVLGLVFQFQRRRNDALTVLTLFIFTGLLMIFYLNQPPLEPRERDYASVGSFQTFCIWIGLGALAIGDLLSRKINGKTAAMVGIGFGLFGGPYLMGTQNWDDHDRSDRYLAISFAKNYLNSCAENAILFTNGDNDTYPLWYAQNVEGIRSDVRIINLSLLSSEWYADALTRKYYKSDVLPMTIMPKEKLQNGQNRDYLRYREDPKGIWKKNETYPLRTVLDWLVSDNPQDKELIYRGQGPINYLPTKKFAIPVNKDAVIASGTVSEDKRNEIVDYIYFTYPSNVMLKGTITMLDIIATNAEQGWKRPIYFTTTTGTETFVGLQNHFRHEGLTYRLVPLKSQSFAGTRGLIDDDLLYDRLMNTFVWGNMDKGEMFLDHKAALVPRTLRVLFAQLARKYQMTDNKEKMKALLDKSLTVIPEKILPMEPSLKNYYIDLYSFADTATAKKLLGEHVNVLEEQAKYYNKMRQGADLNMRNQILGKLKEIFDGSREAAGLANKLNATEYLDRLQAIVDSMPQVLYPNQGNGQQQMQMGQ